MNSLFKGSIVYILSSAIYAFIPFMLLPLLTRVLSKEEYGEIALFQVSIYMFSAFVGLCTQGYVNRMYYDEEDKDNYKQIISTSLFILVISSVALFTLLLVFGKYVSDLLGVQYEHILFALLASTLSFLVQIRLGQWQVRKQAMKFGAFQITQSIVNVGLALVLVLSFNLRGEGRIISIVLSFSIMSVIALFLLYKDGLLSPPRFNSYYFKDAFAFGVPLIPHVAGAFLLSSVDRIVINNNLGLSEAAVYMVALQIVSVIGFLFDAINKAYVPWLFEVLTQKDELTLHRLVKNTYLYFLACLFIAGAFFVLGPYVVVLIAGEKYRAAGEIIGFVALGQCIRGMYLMVTNYIFYMKKTSVISKVTISVGLFNIFLLSILIDDFGLVGVAISYCISMLIQFLATWYMANKSYTMPWFDFSLKKNISY